MHSASFSASSFDIFHFLISLSTATSLGIPFFSILFIAFSGKYTSGLNLISSYGLGGTAFFYNLEIKLSYVHEETGRCVEELSDFVLFCSWSFCFYSLKSDSILNLKRLCLDITPIRQY